MTVSPEEPGTMMTRLREISIRGGFGAREGLPWTRAGERTVFIGLRANQSRKDIYYESVDAKL